MNHKKILALFLILLFILIPATYADTDASYEIPIAIEDITIQDDGSTIISENITYAVSGTINGVYRDIPLSGGQNIDNISVETPGYYNTIENEKIDNGIRIKVYLYKDESRTQKVSDENVEVIFHYNFNKGVKIYNDIAEFQYESWGTQWESGVDNLVTYIHIPGSNDEVEMWNNPSYIVETSTWTSSNTIKTVYNDISSGNTVEQRILMPKSFFTSTENADVINKDAKESIEQQQLDYQNSQNNTNSMSLLFLIFSLILMISPVGIYLKYGREPKILYNAKYESDVPTSDTPLFVNMMMNNSVGEFDINGFIATLLDLVDKEYYKVVAFSDENTIFKRTDKDTSLLKQYQNDVINFMKGFENQKQHISLDDVKNNGDPSVFSKFMDAWKIDVNHEVPELRIYEYFNEKGYSYLIYLSVFSIILSICVFLILLFAGINGQYIGLIYFALIILVVESIILFFLPNHIFGSWTSKGKEFHDKWKNFERYVKDFSLIKENPPASIQVWGKYLVYATALGCADEVSKNMKKYFKEFNVSEHYMYESDIVGMSYAGNLWYFNSAFYALHDSSIDSNIKTGSFGDIGDIGGGFGGGGGGVF